MIGDSARFFEPTPNSATRNPEGQVFSILDSRFSAPLKLLAYVACGIKVMISPEQDRDSALLRLADALSALYPSGSEERRLLDAMLLVIPR
jgi:hypothetical protein